MKYYKDLREYLKVLEDGGLLVRVKRPINKDTELMPLVRLQYRGLSDDERKGFVFENMVDVKGREYKTPVAVSVLAPSAKVYALGLMCQPEEMEEKRTQAELHPLNPVLLEQGPVQEEVHMGDGLMEHGALEEFPIPISTPGFDPSPAITAPFWITKDPESGIRNVGTYRMLIKSPTRTGLDFITPTRGIAIHWNKARRMGIPLEAAIVIGGSPSIGYVSVTSYPVDTDELAVAGGIAGESLELVKCKTVDLEVPAHAEIVIEGLVDTTQMEPEGAFGEAIGVMSLEQIRPFFTVTCITHRKNPIWLAFISQYQPSESSIIRFMGNSTAIYKHLHHDLGFDKVLKVVNHDLFMVVQLKGAATEEVRHVLDAIVRFGKPSKTVIAVDDDINPDDMQSVIHALAHRFQPHRDARIVMFKSTGLSDCSLAPAEVLQELRSQHKPELPTGSRLLIDATRKWPYPPRSLPAKEFMERALQIWQEEGLPELKLKEPLWGQNLGYWSVEDKQKAEWALKGEHYRTGDLQASRRVQAGPHFSPFD